MDSRESLTSDGMRIVTDVCCTQCGCACDDLTVQVRGDRLESFLPGCRLAERLFLRVHDGQELAAAEVQGRPAGRTAAVRAAAQILRRARSPLIYGLSRSATAGQQAACRLAERIGATIDTTASTCHAPSILALQQAGESTSTLGEVRQRSDLVIYWGSNPVRSHPRHVERFVDAAGQDVPQGRADRTVVVVDVEDTESSEIADRLIVVRPNEDFELIHALRAVVRGAPLTDRPAGGVPPETIRELAERMQSCRYGAVFFGLGITHGRLPHLTVDNLLRLVTDLNRKTRFVARRMRVPGDVTGADSVLCWQTGYPFSVNLNRDYPRYNPGEFTANDLLERKEVDAVLLIGTEGVSKLSEPARRSLETLPTIVLDYPPVHPPFRPTVRFRTAIYGVHRTGSVYRMDEVPIPLRAVLPSPLSSDDEVLRAIEGAV